MKIIGKMVNGRFVEREYPLMTQLEAGHVILVDGLNYVVTDDGGALGFYKKDHVQEWREQADKELFGE